MAMIPINPVTQKPKKDAWDKIAQGLEIANSVFKIPVAYEQFRAHKADADVKGAEAESISNLRDGRVDNYAMVKHKLIPQPNYTPEVQRLLPGEEAKPPSLLPGAFMASPGEGKPAQPFMTQDAFKESSDMIKSRREDADKVAARYDNDNRAIRSIESLAAKAEAGDGAAQFQLLKAFNQFNDTPRVTEGEMAAISSAQPWLDRASSLIANWKTGSKIAPPLVQKIVETSRNMHAASMQAQKDALSPNYEDAQAMGLPLNRVMRPEQAKLFEQVKEAAKEVEAGKQAAPQGPTRAELEAELKRRGLLK